MMKNPSGPNPPPAPPPPPTMSAGVRSWRDKKQTSNDHVGVRESLSQPLTISIDGEEVPRALASAFNNPRKDKKPFSYFVGGQAPDLTNKPSPKSVRKSNPHLIVPYTPKVLPIVSDEELEYEEKLHPQFYSNYPQQQNPTHPANMSSPTLVHAQYNSPMSLYSKDNVQEELNRATGGRPGSALGGSNKFNIEQSGAYRMLHGNRVPPQHSARLDEPRQEDYPKYRGFVDPNVQSPSFKRLQHVAGLDSGTEDEMMSQEVRGATSGVRHVASAGPKGEPIPLGYSSSTTTQNQQTTAYQNGPQIAVSQTFQPAPPPQWSSEGPPVAQYDPTEDRDHPLDPNFAAKIAAAERPNVPPSVSPSWARKAEEKQQKWQGYTSQQQQQQYRSSPQPPQFRSSPQPQQYRSSPPRQDYQSSRQEYQQTRQEYQAPRQDYQPPRQYQTTTPQPGWSQPSSQGYQDKWEKQYKKYNFETGHSGQERRDHVITRPRSTDPDSWRSRQKEPWMRPYVAPNVLDAKFSPIRGGSPRNPGGSRPQSYADPAPPSWVVDTQNQQSFGGQSYGPPGSVTSYGSPGQTTYSKKTTKSTYRSERTEGGGRSPRPDFGGLQKDVNISSLVSGEAERPGAPPQHVPDWSHKAVEKRNLWENYGSSIDPDAHRRPPLPDRPPTWTQRADDTTKLWRNESDAWRQRSQMEQDVTKRAASAGPGSVGQDYGSGAYWRQKQVPHDSTVSTYTTTAPPVTQKWQDASGSSTKSQSQGTYMDPEGNQVNYVKEVYTSSDPGKEFSMLTQEEKKTLEEPLQPGVVSRHTTSKYYKKSTYTSQSSTSTNQAPPAVSFPSMNQRPIEAPPRPGQYGPGDTQF